ncbi:MAG TPA: hemolysin family protein [Ilumatobacteraceae bacterium]|nr:hemolysin family protein [Ilumatobacteraceae bacterium]HUV18732.1 hemolysin family protein [Ilumatobacteraceae bacterium]
MGDVWPQLLLVVILVLVNAAFAGTELALVSLRESQLQRLEEGSATGGVLARLARQPNQFLATIQIGITLAGFLASAAAAVSLAAPLEARLDFLGGAAGPVSVVLVTLVLAYFTLVFGELAPKRIAMQRAEKWGMVMARPLDVLSTLTKPIVWLLSISTDLAVRLLGGDPKRQREEVTGEEIRDMVAIHETFPPEQRQIIDGAFEIAERTLDEVMVPRSDVAVIDAAATCREALEVLVETGHSRAPVAERRNLDKTVGMVRLRSLLDRPDDPVTSVMWDIPAFPDAARVLTALREFQARRTQMAVVVDEYARSIGIVTVEDLVEELVGEIWDETDPDLITVIREADGTIVVPGSFPVHDLVDLDVELPEGDYTTIAGLVLDQMNRFPRPGERIDVENWQVEIRTVGRHRITQVALRPLDPDDDQRTVAISQ